MNENVRQLLRKSGLDVYGLGLDRAKWDAAVERFVEGIVRECVDKIETYRIPVGNSPAGEMACEWTYDALKDIRDDIRQHFGVNDE